MAKICSILSYNFDYWLGYLINIQGLCVVAITSSFWVVLSIIGSGGSGPWSWRSYRAHGTSFWNYSGIFSRLWAICIVRGFKLIFSVIKILFRSGDILFRQSCTGGGDGIGESRSENDNRQSGAKGSSVHSWRVVAGLVTVALLVLTIVTVGPVAVTAVSWIVVPVLAVVISMTEMVSSVAAAVVSVTAIVVSPSRVVVSCPGVGGAADRVVVWDEEVVMVGERVVVRAFVVGVIWAVLVVMSSSGCLGHVCKGSSCFYGNLWWLLFWLMWARLWMFRCLSLKSRGMRFYWTRWWWMRFSHTILTGKW